VSNSDALNFLHAIGADLDLLFQALWKHVLCIEFTRSAEDLIKAIVGVLYRVGAIGVKLKNGNRFMYAHLDEALLPIGQFTEDARIRIHPVLWGAFRLQAGSA
jgi:hypothetical protein